MFVFKHTETIEHVKNWPNFLKKRKLCGDIIRDLLGLGMRNGHGMIFKWIRTFKEVFKSALVYLYTIQHFVSRNKIKFNLKRALMCIFNL